MVAFDKPAKRWAGADKLAVSKTQCEVCSRCSALRLTALRFLLQLVDEYHAKISLKDQRSSTCPVKLTNPGYPRLKRSCMRGCNCSGN